MPFEPQSLEQLLEAVTITGKTVGTQREGSARLLSVLCFAVYLSDRFFNRNEEQKRSGKCMSTSFPTAC